MGKNKSLVERIGTFEDVNRFIEETLSKNSGVDIEVKVVPLGNAIDYQENPKYELIYSNDLMGSIKEIVCGTSGEEVLNTALENFRFIHQKNNYYIESNKGENIFSFYETPEDAVRFS